MEAKRPFSQFDWLSIPEPVRAYIIHLEQVFGQMQQRLELIEKRTEKLEARSKMNSQNSSKPPSSDGPFNKQQKKTKKSKRNRGAQKGHKGHQQQMLNPDELVGNLESFEPLWDAMGAKQKEKLIHLLIKQVEWDCETDNIFIAFHQTNIEVFN